MTRRTRLLAIALGAILVAGPLVYVFLRKPPVLTAVTWSGPYGRAQASALFVPYAQKTGVNVHIAEYDGDLGELRRRTASKEYGWDVIDLELPTAIAACREGLLENIDASGLPPGANGEPAKTDFVAGAIGPCWVGSVVYSQIVAYDPHRFGAARP